MPLSISHLLRHIWDVISAVSVRSKILGMALGLVLLLGGGITVQVRSSLAYILQEQLKDESITSARALASRSADPILLNDLVGLQKLLLETQADNPDVRYAFIVNPKGQVLVHTFGNGFPAGLQNANAVDSNQPYATVILQTKDGLVWDTAVTVLDGRAGTVRMGLSDERMRQTLQTVTGQMVLMVVLVSALGVLVATFLTFVLTRPIQQLVQATQAVAKGDFSQRVPRWADDEIGNLAGAFNAMTSQLARTDELRSEREQLRRQLLEKIITTQEEERKRIARELHDSASQSLTSLMLGLKMMENNCDDSQVAAQVDELRQVAAHTLDEVHDLSIRLRPRILDDLGLNAALEQLVKEWQARTKTPVDCVIHIGANRLPAEIETTLYRIVQEALTNIARHADAQSVSVLLERRGDEVITVVEDDGRGFEAGSIIGDSHLGLAGMQERAELLDGSLTIESKPGSGTSLFVRLPLAPLEISS